LESGAGSGSVLQKVITKFVNSEALGMFLKILGNGGFMVNDLIKSPIIVMTLIHKIPPNLPLQREELPLFGKEGRGEIFRCPRQFNFETLNN
jgi:hypothetical protein